MHRLKPEKSSSTRERIFGSLDLEVAVQNGFVKFAKKIEFYGDDDYDPPEAVVLAVKQALESGHCRAGLHVYLSNKILFGGSLKTIASALQSKNCPKKLTLHFLYPYPARKIEHEFISVLMTTLQSDLYQEGLTFVFGCHADKIDFHDLQIITDTLASGKCTKKFGIELFVENIDQQQGAQLFENALTSGKCPNGLTLHLRRWKAPFFTHAFARALSSGQCPEDLTLDLSSHQIIDDVGTTLLMEALSSGRCPPGLTLLFGENLNHARARLIIGTLQSGKLPERLTLAMSFDNGGLSNDETAVALANALHSERCSENITIKLKSKDITDVGVIALSTVLQSKNKLKGLELDFSFSAVTDTGVIELATALQSGHCPSELNINLQFTHLTGTAIVKLKESLLSGKWPDHLTISILDCGVSDAAVLALAEAIENRVCPEGLTIDLGNLHDINYDSIQNLSKALQTGNGSKGLCIKFTAHYESDRNKVQALAQAMESGKCPYGTRIDGIYIDEQCFQNDQRIIEAARRSMIALVQPQKTSREFFLPIELIREIQGYAFDTGIPLSPISALRTRYRILQERHAFFHHQSSTIEAMPGSDAGRALDLTSPF